MKEKFIQFMQGRYGVDTLNNHALFLVIALFVLNIFFNNRIIMDYERDRPKEVCLFLGRRGRA